MPSNAPTFEFNSKLQNVKQIFPVESKHCGKGVKFVSLTSAWVAYALYRK